MSNPANVLDRYRSYSYHHILIACSNQATAIKLCQENDLEAFQQLGSEQVYNVVKEGGVETIVGSSFGEDIIPNLGQYIVLINGMRDTRFTIQQAKWSTLTAAGVNPTDRGNSVAVEGVLTIREARGFKFLNEINRAADAFQTDASGIMYVLKTVFIGQILNSDGSETVESVANIVPLKFLLLNISGAFSPAGGEYKLEFVGASNGGARLPQISRGGENVKFTIDSSALQDVFNQLAKISTDAALENRNNIVEKLKDELPDDQKEEANKLRSVEYKITVEDPYTDGEKYKVTDFHSRYKQKGTEESQGTLDFGKSFTMEHAIQQILERCPQVKKDLNTGTGAERFRYKIFSEVTMKDRPEASNDPSAQSSDVESIVVEYVIRKFVELDNKSVQDILGIDDNGEATEPSRSSEPGSTSQMLQNNLIEFDYYYTGKNVDIKQFDIKLQAGLVFMQTLKSTNNLLTVREQQTSGSTDVKTTAASNILSSTPPDKFKLRSRTPIYPSTAYKDVRTRNIGDPSEMTTFNAYLSRHAALENIEIDMVIRGNPYLLNHTSLPAASDTNPDNNETEQTSENVLINWNKIPALAKVNIRMPDNSDTPSGDPRPDFVDFWYKGFYYIYGMEHNFNEGEFTQKLSMLALPERDILQEKQAQDVNTSDETSDADNTPSNETNVPSDVSTPPNTTVARETSTSDVAYCDIVKTGKSKRDTVAIEERTNVREAIDVVTGRK